MLTAVLASFNDLRAVPSQLVAYGPTLKKLHLGSNQIASVDGLLPSLAKVTELCLDGNRLTSLPESIRCLGKLRELWLHGNTALEALPAALGECASLTVLSCHHCRLSELPDALARLSQLQGLYLQSNRLSGSLAALRTRVLDHLPLQNLALGANRFDLAEAFALADVRVGLGWNLGTPPPSLAGLLTDRFGIVDQLFEPMSGGGRRADVLLVAFAAQGPGMLQWAVPVAAARAAGVSLDALYLADPSNSYYLQDPSGGWGGIDHFDAIIRARAREYDRVLIVGSSMGGTAALMHAHLARRTLAFGPRVDLRRTHGAYVPDSAKAACTDAVMRSLRAVAPGGRVAVHVGRQNAVDVMQADTVRGLATVVEHETFHHNVPMHLERDGALVPLLKLELLELLKPMQDAAAASNDDDDDDGDLLRRFIVSGFVTLPPSSPPESHAAVSKSILAAGLQSEDAQRRAPYGLAMLDGDAAGNNLLHAAPALRGEALLESPHLVRALTLLLGEGYRVHPHCRSHWRQRGAKTSMWHVDAYKGTSWSSGRQHEPHWVMVCYYPQATTLGMGPTELLPGTQHLRGDSDREHYSRGHIPDFGEQMEKWASAPHAVLCEAGSIVVMHFDLWHRALETTDADASRLMLKFVAWRTAPPPAAAAAPPWPLAERRCTADGDPLLAFLAPPPVAAAAAPPSDLGDVCALLDAELRELCAAGALWPAGGAPLGPKAVAAAEAALYDRAVHRAKEHAKGGAMPFKRMPALLAWLAPRCAAAVGAAAASERRERFVADRAAVWRHVWGWLHGAPRARRGRRRRRVARGAARRARRRHRGRADGDCVRARRPRRRRPPA